MIKNLLFYNEKFLLKSPEPRWFDTAISCLFFIIFVWINNLLGIHIYGSIFLCHVVCSGIKYICNFIPSKNWKKRNKSKFISQCWQLVIHVVMGFWERNISFRIGYWDDPMVLWTSREKPVPEEARLVFLLQLGIWCYTAFSHRFLEERRKDYFLMYSHHIVTLILLSVALSNNFIAFGIIVLMIHDLSDIPIDLLKISNYLGLDENSGFYIVEIMFVLNLFTWIYYRFYIYFSTVIITSFFDSKYNMKTPGELLICQIGLCILQVMHIWWFYTISRVGFKIIKGENPKAISRTEYEGSSDDENEE